MEPSGQVGEDHDVDVTIVDILDYVGESVRPIKEGFAVFNANHVICLGYRKYDARSVHITGYVTQSSHPGLAPHKIEMTLRSMISEWLLRCSCKAGTAKCKHIIACLLYIEKYKRIEYLTCTDVTQAWGMSKAQKSVPWGAKRVRDMCCVPTPKKLVNHNEAEEERMVSESFSRILAVSKNSAAYKHIQGRYMNEPKIYPNRAMQSAANQMISDVFCSKEDILICLSSDVNRWNTTPFHFIHEQHQQYYEKHVSVDKSQSVNIALLTKDQNSNEWTIHRSIRITASSCYKLFTYLNNKKPDWDKKIHDYWHAKPLQVRAVKYGKNAECLAFECYKKNRNPLIKKCGLVIHPTESWIAGSPDGLEPLEGVLLEIKCPVDGDTSLVDILQTPNVKRYAKFNDNCNKLELNQNHTYYCQVQINMWILNCMICDFIIYSQKDNDFAIIEVPYNAEYVEKVVNKLKPLYFEKMLPKLIK